MELNLHTKFEKYLQKNAPDFVTKSNTTEVVEEANKIRSIYDEFLGETVNEIHQENEREEKNADTFELNVAGLDSRFENCESAFDHPKANKENIDLIVVYRFLINRLKEAESKYGENFQLPDFENPKDLHSYKLARSILYDLNSCIV